MGRSICLLLFAFVASVSGFGVPQSPLTAPRSSLSTQEAQRFADATLRAPRLGANTVRGFGNFGKKKGPSEAEIAAERAAAQDKLNEKWAKESNNEMMLMTVAGVGTSLPVIYLIYLAVTADDSSGTGVF